MADPVAGVEKIVKLGLAIKEAVDTVRHNEEECREIRKRVLRFSAILSQLQQTGLMNDSPALSDALEDLEESLHQALELVMACQERSTIRRLINAGDLSKQLLRVKDDILNKVMLASFAINAHTTILLLTIQAGGQPLLRQQEDTLVTETTSLNSHSTNYARSELNSERNNVLTGSQPQFAPVLAITFREFKLSELEVATNNFAPENIIGRGGHSTVYKGVLNDGNVVSIKTFLKSHVLCWARSYDIHLLISKLQNKNVVGAVGFKWKEHRLTEMEYFWVEEYMPNGSLDKIIYGMFPLLDWPTLFRIIDGVAQGMHCLHEQGIVHMDMKPSNILLDSDMNPKIVDFGISEVLDDKQVVTRANTRATRAYIAPEYLAEGTVSKKNDVYAFGITLLQTVGSIRMFKPPSECRLDEWAWTAWEGGAIERLFDSTLLDQSQLTEIKRCVEVGLLCAQRDPASRPTMADVLQMLCGPRRI
ncbi:hypothetical protein BS78_K260200, partial [Paspalum vaginatum]